VAEGVVLVTGATGHIGSRLVPELVRAGRPVRALSRQEREPSAGVETTVGDVADAESLASALEGVEAAYYLVHGLADAGDLEDVERSGASTFARAARTAGVGRVVYLGGLAHGDELSPHLRTRQEVGEILRAEGPPTVELRASIVIGEGSASFELVRTLVDSAPLVVLPEWAETPCQPIAVDDVVAYLLESLDVEPGVYEVGGADRITYVQLLELYADATGKGLPTLTVPLPDLPLPSLFARLAPEQARVWLQLVEGLRFDSSVRDQSAAETFGVRPRGAAEAIADALAEGTAS
jgi:uncharacterized protein YbjT (DUF2867 family)